VGSPKATRASAGVTCHREKRSHLGLLAVPPPQVWDRHASLAMTDREIRHYTRYVMANAVWPSRGLLAWAPIVPPQV